MSRALVKSFELSHLRLPLSDYHARPELGSTTLKTLAEDGAEMAAARQAGSIESSSRALVVGGAVHAILDDTFEAAYKSAPDLRGYKTSDTESFESMAGEAAQSGFTLLTRSEWEQVKNCGEAIRRKLAAPLMGLQRWREPSLFWTQETESGRSVACKCRPDIVVDDGRGQALYLEVKTSDASGARAWRAAMWRWGYWLQQAHYEAGIVANGPTQVRTIFVVVRKSAPFVVRLFELDEEDAMAARLRWLALVEEFGRRVGECDWVDEVGLNPTKVSLGLAVEDDLEEVQSD